MLGRRDGRDLRAAARRPGRLTWQAA